METEPSKPRAKDPRLGAKNKEKPREGSGGSKAQAGSRESVGNDTAQFWVGNIHHSLGCPLCLSV